MRLMVMCNLMTLAQVKPRDVYHFFLNFGIDSAEWVMCGNVFGMGTYADGGVCTTRPYVSSDNYIYTMSNFDNRDNW